MVHQAGDILQAEAHVKITKYTDNVTCMKQSRVITEKALMSYIKAISYLLCALYRISHHRAFVHFVHSNSNEKIKF